MSSSQEPHGPRFSAVSSSARQLFGLIRCINLANKAQLQIDKDGIRVTAEESRVMQGSVFLEKSMFTTYNFVAGETSPNAEDEEADDDSAAFMISLPALLETLQIFGFSEPKDRGFGRDDYNSGITASLRRGGPTRAFDNRVLGMTGVCRLSYMGIGEPLCIILEEAGVTTTCELVTFEPEIQEEIPLQRDRLAQKIIMRSTWLYDAITELASTTPTSLTITASPSAPFLTLSSSGALGSASVQFPNDPQLLETFQVPKKCTNTYKFSLIKGAGRAMAIANKVSIRGDAQGVLSLQFMVEMDRGQASFIDFRFVAYLPEEGEEAVEEDDATQDGDAG